MTRADQIETPRRGFFEIGVYHPKTETNIGTLGRSAFQLGAAGVFVIGRRFRPQSSDVPKSFQHIPTRSFDSLDEFWSAIPHGTRVVAVEEGGCLLRQFRHPQQAIYLLGAEDHGLPPGVLKRCHEHVTLGSVSYSSYNVAVAGSIVMYHRVEGFR
jgi:tRNA G18 (ribose-2'-O)-methylase SpoU